MPVKSLGHYRLQEKIGEGGAGVVYRAYDEHLHRDVAIKVLREGALADEEARRHFRKEALMLARLNHPNIETVYDFDTQENTDFLVAEFIPGVSLSERLVEGPLPEEEVARLGRELAEGLQAAHEQGIVHRDLKPGNMRIGAGGRLKIVDFGLASLAHPACADPKLDADTASANHFEVAGTMPYIAPEVLRNQRADERTDVYGAGVVLYEAATGRRPFREPVATALIAQILERPPESVRQWRPELSAWLDEIILRCLEKEADRRYPSARALLAAFCGAPAVKPAGPSIAVLYFEHLSEAKGDEYFRDGITEDIITELSKIKTLRVYPRSAVLALRDQPVTAPEVGRRLGAAFVLAGSLQRAGDRVRITAQLLDGGSGHAVWAERYDRELKDVFQVQEEIARNISRALRITLSSAEEEAIARRPTQNPQAYDLFIRGRGYARRCTRSDLEFAIQMYERALELDRGFALAYACLGIACGLYYDWHEKEPRWLEKTLAASQRALDLDPQLAETQAAYARLCWSQRNYDAAASHALRAIELRNDCENAWWTLGQAYFTTDRWEQAAALTEQAIHAAGTDYNVYIPYMMSLERLGREEEARSVRRRQALSLERHLEQVPDDVRARILLANNRAFFGEAEEAARHTRIAVDLRPNDSNILYNAACTLAILGRKSDALEHLGRAIAAGFDGLAYAVRDPDLACLHDDPQFLRLIQSDRDAA